MQPRGPMNFKVISQPDIRQKEIFEASMRMSNEKIQESIESLKIRSSAWQTQREEDMYTAV